MDTPDDDLITYLLHHYIGVLPDPDKRIVERAKYNLSAYPEVLKGVLVASGWIEDTADAPTPPGFNALIARRILKYHRDKIILNYCPACKKLARTPVAEQCRCGHTWRFPKTLTEK